MAKNDPHLDVKNLVDDPLIQEEERNTGAVTWATYMKYFTFAGGLEWVPAIFMLLVFYQGCQGMYSCCLCVPGHFSKIEHSGHYPSSRILDRREHSRFP